VKAEDPSPPHRMWVHTVKTTPKKIFKRLEGVAEDKKALMGARWEKKKKKI